MTLNELWACAVISSTDFKSPAGIESFVGAVQILFPNREREAILNAPIDELTLEIKTRAEQLSAQADEVNLKIQGNDAVERAKKILGTD